jgi:hypothetical protein
MVRETRRVRILLTVLVSRSASKAESFPAIRIRTAAPSDGFLPRVLLSFAALPRRARSGQAPKEEDGVPNKYIADLKFDSQIPINNVRTTEADIDATHNL